MQVEHPLPTSRLTGTSFPTVFVELFDTQVEGKGGRQKDPFRLIYIISAAAAAGE